MEKNKRIEVEQWLIDNQDVLNMEGIERRANITRGTIQKFLRYNRRISDKRIDALNIILKDIINNDTFKDQKTNSFSYDEKNNFSK